MTTADREGVLTRREYLIIRVQEMADNELEADLGSLLMTVEAVESTALAHPEWDMDETKTWAEWEANHA